MRLKNTSENQMSPYLCFFKNPLSWVVAVLAFLMVYVCLMGFEISSFFLTSTGLILSTLYFTFSKQKPELVEKSFEKQSILEPKSESESESETIMQKEEEEEPNLNQNHEYSLITSPDSLSDISEEDSEGDWPFADHVKQRLDYSDGSISDEESLIEIAIPTGHYVDHKQEDNKKFHLQKIPNFTSDSIFQKQSVLELLAEINDMNEEDNLIEIDISMGSIKYSRFEIEA